MKSIILFFSLIIVVNALSNAFYKREIYDGDDEFMAIYTNTSEECKKELEKKNDIDICVPSVDNLAENYKESCPIFKSDKCQNVYKDIMSAIPSCKNDPKVVDYFTNELMKVKSFPKKIVNDSCHSKVCSDGLIEYFENLTAYAKSINEDEVYLFEKMLDYLKSEECKSLIGTSDAKILKIKELITKVLIFNSLISSLIRQQQQQYNNNK
ncbi:hypothetical protein BCR32DRAFT_250618 [Anaeromyces robustus]|uniref:Uncharacterized protein n=1 Tax=Anaeromyces robustus TaxID=1754192 RepID=A0A1Y1VWB8_9FUNG|nr:hypothetical protein BCR32DRAFT_251863 [Anaeromyces robustus]ORX65589.1 hypothetical protein BCR32DRAFT_250618 [Anaeromyces robustus]|eukprot:ORX48069.1 hypothetical protein BCR32DRAFT_251863 [Anaeromyces robustus]